jgi:hypothetical protein
MDPHYFDKSDLDPHPDKSEKPHPDPHLSEKQSTFAFGICE